MLKLEDSRQNYRNWLRNVFERHLDSSRPPVYPVYEEYPACMGKEKAVRAILSCFSQTIKNKQDIHIGLFSIYPAPAFEEAHFNVFGRKPFTEVNDKFEPITYYPKRVPTSDVEHCLISIPKQDNYHFLRIDIEDITSSCNVESPLLLQTACILAVDIDLTIYQLHGRRPLECLQKSISSLSLSHDPNLSRFLPTERARGSIHCGWLRSSPKAKPTALGGGG